jgi:Tol biopolymer transport system component
MQRNKTSGERMHARTFLVVLAAFGIGLAGCASRGPDESAVVSVSEEGGIRFTPLTEENDAVYVQDIQTQSGRRIPTIQKVFDVSRDGSKLAYLAERDKKVNIYVKNILGGGTRATIQRTFRDTVLDVAISPDARLLAFSDRREGNLNVYMTSAEAGSAIRQVTNSPLDERYPAFSPDNRSLLYVQMEASKDTSSRAAAGTRQAYMWVYDLSRGSQTQYAEGYSAEFAPDSKKVVFNRNSRENQARELWMMELDTGQETLVATDKNRNFMDPTISPDGTKIAFTSGSKDKDDGADRNLDIYLMNTDGSNLTQLTFHPGDDMLPKWGPDGRSIYFLSQRGNSEGKWNIWRMDLRLEHFEVPGGQQAPTPEIRPMR